jgi:predicted AAA+ superfamily ATPase
MDVKNTIYIYGPPKCGKSIFIKKVKGIEKEYLTGDPKPFPTIYVSNEKPENPVQFEMILRFVGNNEVLFEKGFSLYSEIINPYLERCGF